MHPILSIQTTPYPHSSSEFATSAVIRRSRGEDVIRLHWDAFAHYPSPLQFGGITLFTHPLGFEQEQDRAPYSYLILSDEIRREFDGATIGRKIEMVEDAALATIAGSRTIFRRRFPLLSRRGSACWRRVA